MPTDRVYEVGFGTWAAGNSGGERVGRGVMRRRRFQKRVAIRFEPRVACEERLRVFAQSEDDARLDAVQGEIAVQDGRAFPACRRKAEDVGAEQRVN